MPQMGIPDYSQIVMTRFRGGEDVLPFGQSAAQSGKLSAENFKFRAPLNN
jgi:hypothetical protein